MGAIKDHYAIFVKLFPNCELNGSKNYISVPCLFHEDNRNSASFNLTNGTYKCFRNCYEEPNGILLLPNLLKKVLETGLLSKADQVILKLRKENKLNIFNAGTFDSIPDDFKNYWVDNLKFDLKVCEDLEVTVLGHKHEVFSIPVYTTKPEIIYVGTKTYSPKGTIKSYGTVGLRNGYIIPAKKIKESKRMIIVGGEKDMLIGRSLGLPTFTITGGELALPNDFSIFRDKEVFIMYDNDDAGKKGANKLSKEIFAKGEPTTVAVIDGHYGVLNEKEDLWDYFCKYNYKLEDFDKILNAAKQYTLQEHYKLLNNMYPKISIAKSKISNYRFNRCMTNIEFLYTSNGEYFVPRRWTFIFDEAEINLSIKNSKRKLEETRFLEKIENNNTYDGTTMTVEIRNEEKLLAFVERRINISESSVCCSLSGITGKALINRFIKNIIIDDADYVIVHKFGVEDLPTAHNDGDVRDTSIAYYFGDKTIDPCKRYTIIHRIVPHNNMQSRLVSIVSDIIISNDSVDAFSLNSNSLSSLVKFKKAQLNPEKLFDEFKLIIGPHLNRHIFFGIFLAFGSPLKMTIPSNKNISGTIVERCAIHCTLIGDTRIGKTEVYKTLSNLFEVGSWVSAKGSTPQSIIGGSAQLPGSKEYVIKSGVIGKCNNGLLLIDEFHGKIEIIRALTTVKSANELRITRVSGEKILPAFLRLIEIANPLYASGNNRPSSRLDIKEYKHGVDILTRTMGENEDIARADYVIVASRKSNAIDIISHNLSFDQLDWKALIRWIWSRKAHNVVITPEVFKEANRLGTLLDHKFNLKVQIIGASEIRFKICRIAATFAALTLSTDDYYEIIVTKQHVEWAVKFLKDIYDNEDFRIREAVAEKIRYERPTFNSTKQLKKKMEYYKSSPQVADPNFEIFLDILYTSKFVTKEEASVYDTLDRTHAKFLIKHSFLIPINQGYRVTDKYKKTIRDIRFKQEKEKLWGKFN